MSDIDIRRAHSLPLPQARKHAESMADALRQQFELESEWDGNILRFSRHGVNGALAVSKSDVRITAKLGFLLAFLKPQIEQNIHDNLDRIFAAPETPPAAAKPARKSAKPKR